MLRDLSREIRRLDVAEIDERSLALRNDLVCHDENVTVLEATDSLCGAEEAAAQIISRGEVGQAP
jgi:hypothetical protein